MTAHESRPASGGGRNEGEMFASSAPRLGQTILPERFNSTSAANWSSSGGTSWLDLLLLRIRYRDTWRFQLHGSWPGAAGSTGPCLTITALVDDSTTGADLRLTHTFQVPPHLASGLYDEEACIEWVWQCVMAVERHEAREFFRVDGKRWRDPHRDNNTRLYQ